MMVKIMARPKKYTTEAERKAAKRLTDAKAEVRFKVKLAEQHKRKRTTITTDDEWVQVIDFLKFIRGKKINNCNGCGIELNGERDN